MEQRMRGQKKGRFLVMKGLLLGLALLWLAGCTSGDGRPRTMEADWGRSVTNNRMEMMVTPPDAVDPKPPLGISPQAAKNTQDRYDKSFKEKEEPPTVKWIIK